MAVDGPTADDVVSDNTKEADSTARRGGSCGVLAWA
jgi:hypothetical protein